MILIFYPSDLISGELKEEGSLENGKFLTRALFCVFFRAFRVFRGQLAPKPRNTPNTRNTRTKNEIRTFVSVISCELVVSAGLGPHVEPPTHTKSH